MANKQVIVVEEMRSGSFMVIDQTVTSAELDRGVPREYFFWPRRPEKDDGTEGADLFVACSAIGYGPELLKEIRGDQRTALLAAAREKAKFLAKTKNTRVDERLLS